MTLEEYKGLLDLCSGTDEDWNVAISNIDNLKLSDMQIYLIYMLTPLHNGVRMNAHFKFKHYCFYEIDKHAEDNEDQDTLDIINYITDTVKFYK